MPYELLTNSVNTHNSNRISYIQYNIQSTGRSTFAVFRKLNENWIRSNLFRCVMLHKVLRVACCFTSKQIYIVCLVRFGTPNRTVRFDSTRHFWMCLSIIIININNKLLFFEKRYICIYILGYVRLIKKKTK